MRNHDEEMPSGFQDADFEMASLTRLANRESRLRRAGKCAHGWIMAPAGGPVKCNHCGAVWATEAEHDEARRAVLGE